MQITLVRHAQTPGNALRRYIGSTDEPLSEAGLLAARACGADRSVRRVFVTPLQRTAQTAALLFPAAEQIILPALREMDFGLFEGRNADELSASAAYRAWVDGLCEGPCPGGESRAAFTARVLEGFTAAVTELLAEKEEAAVFVVHGGTIMAILSGLARPALSYFSCAVGNCARVACRTAPGEGALPFTLCGVRLPAAR